MQNIRNRLITQNYLVLTLSCPKLKNICIPITLRISDIVLVLLIMCNQIVRVIQAFKNELNCISLSNYPDFG